MLPHIMHRGASPILLFFAILSFHCVLGQPERVYLQLDKYQGWPGDTIWFKGYIFQNDRFSRQSTNLEVELFDASGTRLCHDVFPVFSGESIGQIVIPNSLRSANYYLRASTRLQFNFDSSKLFTVPIYVYNRLKVDTTIYHRSAKFTSNFYTSNRIGNFQWITQSSGGKIYSQVIVADSTDKEYRLSMLQKVRRTTGAKDSDVVAELTIDRKSHRFAVFVCDTIEEHENLYLFLDSKLIGKQYLHFGKAKDSIKLSIDTLDTGAFGNNCWTLQFPDTLSYVSSICVTDADRTRTPPLTIGVLDSSHTDDLTRPISIIDTEYLTIKGQATTEKGKDLITSKTKPDDRLRQLVVLGTADSSFLFTKVIPVNDRGYFSIDSVFVFGPYRLNFQLNTSSWKGKNVSLHLEPNKIPLLDTSEIKDEWEEDVPIAKADTLYTKNELGIEELARMKTLQTVTVKRFKSPRELDKVYTTGVFTEPTLFAYDTRQDSSGLSLIEYLRRNMGAIDGGYSSYDTPTYMGHKMIFYKGHPGETPAVQLWPFISNLSLSDIAYIKCWESDFVADDFDKQMSGVPLGFTWDSGGKGGLKIPSNKTPMIVAIFTKKEVDYRLSPGGLNQISLTGYSKINTFRSDRLTLYWNAFVYANCMKIRFTNNDHTRRFRVIAEGVNRTGKVVHLEKIIE